MQLQVTDREADSLYLALGISEERSDELCDQMTALVKEYAGQVLLVDIYYDIIRLCNTLEEVVFCMDTHVRWLLAVTGQIPVTRKR